MFSSVVSKKLFISSKVTSHFAFFFYFMYGISCHLVKGCARWHAFSVTRLICEFHRTQQWPQSPWPHNSQQLILWHFSSSLTPTLNWCLKRIDPMTIEQCLPQRRSHILYSPLRNPACSWGAISIEFQTEGITSTVRNMRKLTSAGVPGRSYLA